MRTSRSQVAAAIGLALVVACSPATNPAPIAGPAQTAPPPVAPAHVSATLPVRGSAREIGLGIQVAPAGDGSLFVSIPASGGSILALFDRGGRPRPGWPIKVRDSSACGRPLPVEDGSVRIVCDASDLAPPELDANDVRAFAFDAGGRLMAGWPVRIRPAYTGRMVRDELSVFADEWRVVGDVLTLLELVSGGDVIEAGQPHDHARVVTVAPDGALRTGVPVPVFDPQCCQWVVGPDGVAYGTALVSGLAKGSAVVSRMTALDLSGARAGWPVSFDGLASGPAFRPDGSIVVTVASIARRTSRLLVLDLEAAPVPASSAELAIPTGDIAWLDGTYECGMPVPKPPLVAQDGGMFVFSVLDTAVFALDPSLEVRRSWPYLPASPLERPDPLRGGEGISCPSLALPTVGPDSTLYLPLQARDATVGGSVIAVDREGRVRPDWPVGLRRPGAEFWSVVVGSDGTAYALAIEPEAGNASSASILAIAPGGAVLYTSTIVDP